MLNRQVVSVYLDGVVGVCVHAQVTGSDMNNRSSDAAHDGLHNNDTTA